MTYIGVWVLAAIFSRILMQFSDDFVAGATIDYSNKTMGAYWIIAPIAQNAAFCAVFIAVYTCAGNLKVSKVIPWVIGLGGLGIAISLVGMNMDFNNAGLTVPVIYHVSTVASFFAAVALINWFFQTKQPHRY
jgi:hypothetical protein